MDLLAAMRVFCDVAEQGRLTLSAASRGVNPSVLSRQISALESEVGGRLLHRTGRGVVLTEMGLSLLPRCRGLVEDADAILVQARGEIDSPSGTVNIGLVPVARPLSAALVALARERYPRLRIRTHEAFSGQIHEWVTSGRLDVGVFNSYGRGIVKDATVLLRTPMVVVAPRDLPLVRQPEVPFRSMNGVPMVAPLRPNAMVDALQAIAQRAHIELNFVFEGGSESIVRDSVAHAGLCAIVALPSAMRDYGPDKFAWSVLVQPRLTQTMWIAHSHARPASAAVRLVAGELRRLADQVLHVETR